MFSEPLKVKVNKEEATVTLSIRTTDMKVEVHTFPLAIYKRMVAEFQAAIEEE